jgi:hypothetical protein
MKDVAIVSFDSIVSFIGRCTSLDLCSINERVYIFGLSKNTQFHETSFMKKLEPELEMNSLHSVGEKLSHIAILPS